MPDKIISLCYVSKRNDKSTELCRIADLIDGDFVPYTYSTGIDFYDTNRDLIYGSTSELQAELESIGVFEWNAYLSASNEWRTRTSKATDVSWCEVIFTKHGTIEQLVQVLKIGYPMTKYDRLHDIILCCRPTGSKCEASYISKADAAYRDGKLCLNDSVATLPRDTLDIRYAVGECKCRYSPQNTRKYLASKQACHVVGTVEVKSKDEIVGSIIWQFIDKDALPRKERQAARKALEKLSMPSIVEMIAARFQCSNTQAEKYAEEYIVRTHAKLEATDTQRLIELLIENDSEATRHMQAAVQKRWDETQQEQIQAAQHRQAEAAETLDAVRKQIAEADKTLKETKSQQAEIEVKVKETQILLEQVEAKIQKRIEDFKTDYASALVENAVIKSAIMPHQHSGADHASDPNHSKWMITLPDNSTDISMLEENIDVAIENWEIICANKDMARGLTLLTFAAYAKNQPLLLVGESAILVSDLISSSICGQPAIKICATDETQDFQSIVEEIGKKQEAVVCLVNGLKAGYDHFRMLMQLCPQRMFVVTEMHSESLALEPTSLFTVFFPVFCDFFYNGKQADDLPTCDCCEGLYKKINQMTARSIKEAKACVSQWLNSGFYPPVVRERCANLLAAMNLLAQMLGIDSNNVLIWTIELLFTPLLKCMRKEDSLKTHLEECTILDSDRKASLISFISMEE